MYSSNFTNVIQDATRITATSSTLIDVALTSIPANVTNSGSFNTCISDHNLIFTTLRLSSKLPKSSPKLITVRNYKNINLLDLKSDLESVPWNLIDIFDDPDDSAWCWEELLKQTISQHVHPRKVKVRSHNQPWMNGEIRKQLNNRYKLFNKAKVSSDKNSKEWRDYKKLRNICTNLIRDAKANFWKNEFSSSNCSKSFWKTVKKFNGSSSTLSTGPLSHKSTIITDDKQKSNLMNSFFANVGERLATKVEPQLPISNSLIYRVTPCVSQIIPDVSSFNNAFDSSVKLGKACGPDNISAQDLKLCEPIAINVLFKVFKKSVEAVSFPEIWKTAKVTCLHKKGSKKDCNNYRPISLLSISSKVVECFICTMLNSHLENNNLLSPNQWGFRKKSSTEDLLLHMIEKWHLALDNGKSIAVLFIDYQKAFDSVSHDILLNKLSACGISGLLYEYIHSYLRNRSQYTVLNGVKSEKKSVRFGVPQGSILGPNLFSVFVNDMPQVVKKDGDLELFADDTTAVEFWNSIDEAVSKIKKDYFKD